MIVERLVQRQTSNEGLAVLKRPSARRSNNRLCLKYLHSVGKSLISNDDRARMLELLALLAGIIELV